MKKSREWAVIGRTFRGVTCSTLDSAYEMVKELGDRAVEYDGEVTILHKENGEWKEYERFW